MRRTTILTAALAALALPAAAQETRELDAHVHGESTLDIAVEGERVTMRLAAPGADIVGFEHAAETDEDRAAIEAAEATLGEPLDLFVLPDAAGCKVTEATARLVTEEDGEGHAEGEHAHDDHEGGAQAAHDHGDDHAHDDDGAATAGAEHSEFVAEYALLCTDPDALDGIEFAYFDAFPNAEEVDVQVVGRGPAQGYEVERASPVLDLGGSI